MAQRGRGDAELVWRERLERYRRSGLTVEAFCRREGVSTSNFYGWKRRVAKRSAASTHEEKSPEESPLFVPVAMNSLGSSEVRIALPGGAVVHLPEGVSEHMLACAIRAAGANGEGEAC